MTSKAAIRQQRTDILIVRHIALGSLQADRQEDELQAKRTRKQTHQKSFSL
jgi:hypothetical protein